MLTTPNTAAEGQYGAGDLFQHERRVASMPSMLVSHWLCWWYHRSAVVVFRIQYDPEAVEDLAHHKHEASMLRQQIAERLRGEPLRDTTNNGPMRPNPFGAERRLRIDPFRVLYAVREQNDLVYVLAICKKERNRVYHRGKATNLDV